MLASGTFLLCVNRECHPGHRVQYYQTYDLVIMAIVSEPAPSQISVAHCIGHWTSDPKVEGSIPGCAFRCFSMTIGTIQYNLLFGYRQ